MNQLYKVKKGPINKGNYKGYLFFPIFILQEYEHLFKHEVNLLQELIYSPCVHLVPFQVQDKKARLDSTFKILNTQVPRDMHQTGDFSA